MSHLEQRASEQKISGEYSKTTEGFALQQGKWEVTGRSALSTKCWATSVYHTLF